MAKIMKIFTYIRINTHGLCTKKYTCKSKNKSFNIQNDVVCIKYDEVTSRFPCSSSMFVQLYT